MVNGYKGDPAVAAGETFDATPANLDARAERYTLANGMKVALLPKKTRGGTVHFYLSMHYGDEASIKGREGEARLTGSMLMRGTSQHDRQQIADTLDRLRASLSISGGQTALTARGQTLRANLAPTLDLLAEVLQHPSFPSAELDTLKRAQTAGLEQERSDPRAIAVRALARYDNPYPKGDDRYMPTFDEEIAEIKAPGRRPTAGFSPQLLRRERGRDQHRRRLRRRRRQGPVATAVRRMDGAEPLRARPGSAGDQARGGDADRDSRQGQRLPDRRRRHSR